MTVGELIEKLQEYPALMLVTLSETAEPRDYTPVVVDFVDEEVIDRWWEVGANEIAPQETAIVLRGA